MKYELHRKKFDGEEIEPPPTIELPDNAIIIDCAFYMGNPYLRFLLPVERGVNE